MRETISITIILALYLFSISNIHAQTVPKENNKNNSIFLKYNLLESQSIEHDSLSKQTTLATISQIESNNTKTNETYQETSEDHIKHQTSKYLIGETAFGLKKSQKLYQNILGVINTIGFGISDNFTLNLSTELYSLFAAGIGIFLINPKFTFGGEDDKIRFGIGANIGIGISEFGFGSGGTFYGLTTIGTAKKNFTLGAGFIYDTEHGIQSNPLFQIGATLPISPKFSIMFESYLLFENGVESIILPTLRYTNNYNTVDIGLLDAPGLGGDSIPVLSISKLF